MDGKAGNAEQSSDSQASLRACPACGAEARRVDARYCSACGCSLDESYLPTDALRASYNLEQRHRTVSRNVSKANVKPLKSSMSSIFPARNNNGASTTALAFVTYSLVPYLGILFCPGAVVMGSVGLFNSYRAPERGGRRASYMGVTFGVLIFCAQIFLWWILYKIPEWAAR
jgi:hypothetical protein